MSRAGLIELAASVMAFMLITASLVFISGRKDASDVLSKALERAEVADKAQVLVARYGYIDPHSENIYPIIDIEKIPEVTESSFLVETSANEGAFPLPILTLRNGSLVVGALQLT